MKKYVWLFLCYLALTMGSTHADQPTSHSPRQLEGWTILLDDRLSQAPHEELTAKTLRFLESKLFDITVVVPPERVQQLRTIKIVLDLECGDLGAMQFHPDAGWLRAHGYSPDLAKCVHLPRAKDVVRKRNINEQPWCILHELAHAYHDQFLTFEEPRVLAAFEQYKRSGRGDTALLYNGKRVKHYALTNHKEFFAEMTESFFGVNDFFPFTRAELIDSEPELHQLLTRIWLEKPE